MLPFLAGLAEPWCLIVVFTYCSRGFFTCLYRRRILTNLTPPDGLSVSPTSAWLVHGVCVVHTCCHPSLLHVQLRVVP